MQRFWETIIKPAVEILQPETIVEIGSDTGGNTRNILEFCWQSNAKLHVIDPAPKYDVPAWQKQYGDHMIFHKALSLNALPLIDEFDVVLIDGDHNWYTVFNELGLIEKRCEELSRPFPLVMLHDVGWPYGRRDLYYEPETIPEKYRKPYEQKGMHPESTGLLEKGGINPHLRNALRENEPRSGVLTAVEDFMQETEQRLELLNIPGLNGFGILVPLQLKEQNKALARFFDTSLNLPENVARLMEQVERDRMDALARVQEVNLKVHELNLKVQEVNEQWQEANEQWQEANNRLQEANEQWQEANNRLQEAYEQLRREMEDMQSSRGWRIANGIDVAILKLRGILRR